MAKSTDFLELLIDNTARAKLLREFILHPLESFTLVEIGRRAKVGPHSVRAETEFLHKLGIVKEDKGTGIGAREKVSSFSYNEAHKHAHALSTFVHATSPVEFTAIEQTLRRVGKLGVVILSGMFMGDMQRPADLIVVGDFINEDRLEKAVRSFEPQYGREIRYVVFSTPECRYRLTIQDKIIRETLDHPHRVLIDRARIL